MMERGSSFVCFIALVLILLAMHSCGKDDEPKPGTKGGKLSFTVEHRVGSRVLEFDQLSYTNAAGNQYMVTDLMYFISEITLYRHDGLLYRISEGKDIFYIDGKTPATMTLAFADIVPAGTYDSIACIFGIMQDKNKTGYFVNPPEALMGWPDVLGGGYHYMMANGKWKDPGGVLQPFNFHLGIGQLYHGVTYNVDSIYAFVQNYFRVRLPQSGFVMNDQGTVSFLLTMDLQEWFENPHIYDFNYWGGAIMQNQAAQQVARENGWNAFSIKKQDR